MPEGKPGTSLPKNQKKKKKQKKKTKKKTKNKQEKNKRKKFQFAAQLALPYQEVVVSSWRKSPPTSQPSLRLPVPPRIDQCAPLPDSPPGPPPAARNSCPPPGEGWSGEVGRRRRRRPRPGCARKKNKKSACAKVLLPSLEEGFPGFGGACAPRALVCVCARVVRSCGVLYRTVL